MSEVQKPWRIWISFGSVDFCQKMNTSIIDMSNELRVKFPEDSIRLLEKFTVGG